MKAFEWNARYVTGIEVVDAQHLHLVEMINQVAEMKISDDELRKLKPIIGALTDYAGFHFTTEEDLMRSSGCDTRHQARHTGAHADFVHQVQLFAARVEAGSGDALKSMLDYLVSWLAFHILGDDQAMARQIEAIRAGVPPADAYQRNAPNPDNASAVLIDALSKMYDQVARANAALHHANLELEARVAERTSELRQAHDKLVAEHEAQQALIRRLEDAQNQLLQSEKMASIGQLAAGVAHEINNPIGFVSSNMGSLKEYVDKLLGLCAAYRRIEPQLQADSPDYAAVQAAKQQADIEFLEQDIVDLIAESQDGLQRVKRIVQDLREFSHVDEAQWQQADLNAGLDSTLNVAWNEVKYKAQVVKEYGDLPRVECIPAQINQVFLNLIVNAAQAIREAGTLTLRTGSSDESAWVEVEDTGCGMPPEVQQRMFDPFFTTKPVGKGTGLGLSLAYGIVNKHGGRFDVRSQPGQGTAVRVILPIRQVRTPEASAGQSG
jgi:hemerythrin-like metal-binding protein